MLFSLFPNVFTVKASNNPEYRMMFLSENAEISEIRWISKIHANKANKIILHSISITTKFCVGKN